jgi:muramoyltetrapeptide carboxypeptidase
MRTRIAIIAASSAVPLTELAIAVDRLQSAGFAVDVQPSVYQQHFVFAGDDEARASGIYTAALSDAEILWCACGGYGAARTLPILDRLTAERGTPKPKLLVGFSDVTALMNYARTHWGWQTLHGLMPASSAFREKDDHDWAALLALVRGEQTPQSWGNWPLSWIGTPPTSPIEGELIGGNLTVLASLAGTPYAQPAKGKILFLEDIAEQPYRLDRKVNQLHQSGYLEGTLAIVLGGFNDCEDQVSQVLPKMTPAEYAANRAAGEPINRVPLRKQYTINEALAHIFADLNRRTGIPVAKGLPVGHGEYTTPLPLGMNYRLAGEPPTLNYSTSSSCSISLR